MKHKLGLMAAMIGLAATSRVATTNTVDFNRSVNSAEKLVSQGPTQKTDGSRINPTANHERVTLRNERSSVQKFGWNPGISPKTYGMHHVKRGTHKRTNV
ncbi:MAG: hypothetical protein L6264_07350 [Weeksellaceae bacterium]|nr:hypothetical protein [Bacteroidota bacterium]MCG2780749.1 hypothetical protein [Weeksellaceae bacterium]